VRFRLRLAVTPPSRLLLALLAAGYACAFGDVFKSAGPGDVQFVWVGDTIVTVDSAMHFEITLLVDGVAAATPVVRVAIPDTTVIRFGATPDSIVGVRPGNAGVDAWVESSLAPRVDTVFRVRARP
jgi:hypothetical protein